MNQDQGSNTVNTNAQIDKPNTVTISSGHANATTRTMASDQKRAGTIEAERQAASQAALQEIMALEAAIMNASEELDQQITPKELAPEENQNETPAVDDQALGNPATKPSNKMDWTTATNITTTPTPVNIEKAAITVNQIEESLPITPLDPTENTTTGKSSATITNLAEQTQEKTIPKTDDLGITYLDDSTSPEPIQTPTISPKRDDDPRISALQEEISRIEKSKLEFAEKRAVFTAQESPLKKQIEAHRIKQQSAEAALRPFLTQQQTLDDRIAAIESEERTAASPEDRHRSEQKRWQLEDDRHNIEAKKWEAQRDLERIINEIETLERQVREIQDAARATDQSIADADLRIKELDIEVKLVKLGDTKQELEARWVELNNEKRYSEAQLDETRNKEAVIEAEIDSLAQMNSQGVDANNRIEFEKKRQEITLERRELEKERWELELSLKTAENSIEDLKPKYQKALDDEKAMFEELEKLKN